MNIVFLDAESVPNSDLTLIQQKGSLTCYKTTEANENLGEILKTADIIISNKVKLDAQSLSAAPRLKLICVAATGYNNIDIAAAAKYGITVCNVSGYSTDSVAQHFFAMLLNWNIQLQQYQLASQNGQWLNSHLFCCLDYPIVELKNKTLTLIGYGNIAQAIEKLALAFGMHVIIAERQNKSPCRANRVPFDQAIAQADIVSLHCPLTPETANMVDAHFIEKLKPQAILINTARGGLINENALALALKNKQIQAALLDGLSQEPPTLDNPLLIPQPNLMITPHTAWASQEARQTLVNEIALNIEAFKQGKKRNQITSL